MSSDKKLCQLNTHEKARILRLDCPPALGRRLVCLGFAPGDEVRLAFRAPGGDPSAYLVQNCLIALRNSDAEKIIIE